MRLLNFPPSGAHQINKVGEPFIVVGGKWEKKKEKRQAANEGRERREESAEEKRERKKESEKKKREKEKGRKAPIKLRLRVICGPIELKFCQRVSGSIFFILTGWFILRIFLPTFFVDVFVEPPFGEIFLIFSLKMFFA